MRYDTKGYDIDELYMYLRKMLDLYILLKAPPKYVIKTNLRDVYIFFIIAQILDMTISSKESSVFVMDMLGYKDIDIIYSYKTKLRRIGWFVQDEQKKYSPIKAFNFTKDNFTNTKSYSFTIEYKRKKVYNEINSKHEKF